MRICLIYSPHDARCGLRNFGDQCATALRRAGHDITVWDGAWEAVSIPRDGAYAFFPPDVESYDVVHLNWHAPKHNHYNGATWPQHPVRSWWDQGPPDATCPFAAVFDIGWSTYPRGGYRDIWYPIPDWVEALPSPAVPFTVGTSSVRGDGVAQVQEVCTRHGWAMNLPDPTVWRSLEDEVRRLARSTVNVCWYHTAAHWRGDRAGAPSTMLASKRSLVINHDHLLEHLWEAPDLYHTGPELGDLEQTLCTLASLSPAQLRMPHETYAALQWRVACTRLVDGWQTTTRRPR